MGYLTAKQLSEKWGISERRIIKLCNENRIVGAVKNGKIWIIPEDTIKPSDKRNNVSKFINTQKRSLIINPNNSIGIYTISLLQKEGYIIDVLHSKEDSFKEKISNIQKWRIDFKNIENIHDVIGKISKYYDNMIFFDIENTSEIDNKEFIVNEVSKKMNCESSIVIVNNVKNDDSKIEKKLSSIIKENIGIRINSLIITAPMDKNIIIRADEIAEDILDLSINFKNTTGQTFYTDGGCLEFDENDRTNGLEIGYFYRAITSFFKRLNKNSYMWCASTMMDDEWTEEPLEMDFRVQNLEAANRGAKMDRIFIFSKSKIKEFKKNNSLKIYMQSNINTLFVDYDEIKNKRPDLLDIVGDGWDGIDDEYLLADLPCDGKLRGYISKNKLEVTKAFECFKELKKYSKDLKEVLK